MKSLIALTIGAAALTITACGGKGDDALGDNAAEAGEAQAENLEAMADNSSGAAADSLEAQAEVAEETGEAKEEAIDDADVNADAMTPAQKDAMTNVQ